MRNHPHRALHAALRYRLVGRAGAHDDVTDAAKSAIVDELCTDGSALRALFDADTLAHLHPNVARLQRALACADGPERDALVDEALRVDAYACVDGALVPVGADGAAAA